MLGVGTRVKKVFTNIFFRGIMKLVRYIIDKLEFAGANDENFIYDWWHYGSWKNNCVPTAQTGFTE